MVVKEGESVEYKDKRTISQTIRHITIPLWLE